MERWSDVLLNCVVQHAWSRLYYNTYTSSHKCAVAFISLNCHDKVQLPGCLKQENLFLSQFWMLKSKAKHLQTMPWAPLQGEHVPCLLQSLVALLLGGWKQYSSPSLHHHMMSPPSLLFLFPSPLHYPLIYSLTKPFPEVTSQCLRSALINHLKLAASAKTLFPSKVIVTRRASLECYLLFWKYSSILTGDWGWKCNFVLHRGRKLKLLRMSSKWEKLCLVGYSKHNYWNSFCKGL